MGRNVFDEDYAVRGFFFGNEPPLFEDKRYVQLGEPQQFGVTAHGSFVDAYLQRSACIRSMPTTSRRSRRSSIV